MPVVMQQWAMRDRALNPYKFHDADDLTRAFRIATTFRSKLVAFVLALTAAPQLILTLMHLPSLFTGPDYPEVSQAMHLWLCLWPWFGFAAFTIAARAALRRDLVPTLLCSAFGGLILAAGLRSLVWFLNTCDYPI